MAHSAKLRASHSSLTPSFRIDFQRQEARLRWTLSGFWTVEVAHAFKAVLAAEMIKVRRTHRRFTSLSDTRGFPVQSAEVMQLLATMSRSSANNGSRKLAILVSTALNDLQANHSLASDRIRVFREEAKALDWLAQRSRG